MKKILKNVDNDKQQQHSKLMDEFRKAHRKMFQANENTKEEISPSKEKTTSVKDTMVSNLIMYYYDLIVSYNISFTSAIFIVSVRKNSLNLFALSHASRYNLFC